MLTHRTGTIQGSSESVPTVADNLKSQGKVGVETMGIFFPPYASNASGSITFGGVDATQCTGSVGYAPITNSNPSNDYWGVDQSISYAGKVITNSTSGIVDSGTTMILLASDHYQAYTQATGAVKDSKTGMLSLTNDQFANLQPLDFNIGGQTWSLSANGQIWPRSLNSALGGDNDHVYLVVSDVSSTSGLLRADADMDTARQRERRRLRLHQRLHVHAALLYRPGRDEPACRLRNDTVHRLAGELSPPSTRRVYLVIAHASLS